MTQATAKSFFVPALLWIGAFICALYPVNTYQLELFTGSVVLLFAWMIVMLVRDINTGWNVPKSAVLMFAGLFWALVVCSVFWSEVRTASLLGMCFFSVMPLTFFGGVMAGREGYFRKLLWPMVAIFVVLALWAVFQFFFLNNYFNGQARHPLADPSSLGALFSLAFFCALGAAVFLPAGRGHKTAMAVTIILLLGIMATVSRGPLFAMVPALPVFVVLLWPQVRTRWKSLLLVFLAAIAFYGVMQTGVQKRLDLGARLLGTMEAGFSQQNNNRVAIWSSAIDIIKDHPWLGTGIGTFSMYYPEYRRPNETDGVYLTHNDPLQFWAELGALGPILFYAFVFAAAARTFRALKKMPQDSGERVLVVSIFAGLIAMVAHSHISFNHYNLSILMLTGLLLSVWFCKTSKALEEPQRIIAMPDNMPHNANKALLVMPFLMVGWLFLSVTGGEHFANKARDALFRQDMNGFMNDINMGDKVSMRLNARTFLFAVNVPMAILDDRKSTLNVDQQEKLFKQVMWYMQDALAINPRSATPYYYMARVQSLVDPSVIPEDMETPQALYEKALRLDPMHLGSRMELFKLYKADGKTTKELLALMEPTSNYIYNTTAVRDYYGALANLYLEDGDYGKVKEIMLLQAAFEKRSDYSLARQNTSIPQAVMGADQALQ